MQLQNIFGRVRERLTRLYAAWRLL